jgi:hypothetical protein
LIGIKVERLLLPDGSDMGIESAFLRQTVELPKAKFDEDSYAGNDKQGG